MSLESLVIVLIIGAIAGWLAGTIMTGRGYGLVGNIVLGILGSFIGAFIFSLLNISAGGIIGTIVVATIGAIVLIWLVRALR